MVVVHPFTLVLLLLLVIGLFSSFSQGRAANEMIGLDFSPFKTDLETLQKQIGYHFTNINLLGQAMTHASFSQENNKALTVLGTHIIETSVSLQCLVKDIDMSSKALNNMIAKFSNVNSCALDGKRLDLQKIIRVSTKTDASNAAILCAGFRAIFGAIATDAGKADEAIKVFWKVHGGRDGNVASM